MRLPMAISSSAPWGLDMAAAGWKPTVDNYLGRVPKARILEAVREGALIRLMFRTASPHLQGLQLQPIIEAIRTRRAVHVYEFDAGHDDPPEPGAPFVTEIWFETERAKVAANG
jgi:hypothetical protein